MSVFVGSRLRLFAVTAGVALGLVLAATLVQAQSDQRTRDRPGAANGRPMPAVVQKPKPRVDLIDLRDRAEETTGSSVPTTLTPPPADQAACVVGCAAPIATPATVSIAAMQMPTSAATRSIITIAAPATSITVAARDMGSIVECMAGCYGDEPRRLRATGGPPPLLGIAALRSQTYGHAIARAIRVAKPVRIASAKRGVGKKRYARWVPKSKRRSTIAKARSIRPVVAARAAPSRPTRQPPIGPKQVATPLVSPPPPTSAAVVTSLPPPEPEVTPSAATAATMVIVPATPAPQSTPAPGEAAATPTPAKRSMVTGDWFNRINRERAAAKAEADAASHSDE